MRSFVISIVAVMFIFLLNGCSGTTPIKKLAKAFLKCRQYLPADYAFYNDKAYYYDTNINPIKAAAAKAIVGVMIHMRKDRGPGNIQWPKSKKEA